MLIRLGGQGVDFSRGNGVHFVDGLEEYPQAGIKEFEKRILKALKDQTERGIKVTVILDGIDFLIAGMGVQVEEVMDTVAEIREVSFSPNGGSAASKLEHQIQHIPFWRPS